MQNYKSEGLPNHKTNHKFRNIGRLEGRLGGRRSLKNSNEPMIRPKALRRRKRFQGMLSRVTVQTHKFYCSCRSIEIPSGLIKHQLNCALLLFSPRLYSRQNDRYLARNTRNMSDILSTHSSPNNSSPVAVLDARSAKLQFLDFASIEGQHPHTKNKSLPIPELY